MVSVMVVAGAISSCRTVEAGGISGGGNRSTSSIIVVGKVMGVAISRPVVMNVVIVAVVHHMDLNKSLTLQMQERSSN